MIPQGPLPDHVIERARAVPIEGELGRRGVKLRRVGLELTGPCPVCGGTDRFSVNVKKQVWNCRGCAIGGDTIKLVKHVHGVSFKNAIEMLADNTARATPQAKPAPARRYDPDDELRISRAAWFWSQRKAITEGTPPALYLRKRGFTGPIPATLAYIPARDFHPASMIAAFGVAAEHEPRTLAPPKVVAGIHLTRLTADGDKAPDAAGKAKIMLGTCKGAPIVISPPNDTLGMA